MKPPVTPIFPGNNGPVIPDNLPIRKTDSRRHILNSGGFYTEFNPHIYHSSSNSHSHQPNSHQPQPLQLNCVDIARHIDTCPICSRLYDTDKTLYILAIIGLLILCFLMVKRIVKL
jgi:hypothetical protein